MCSASTRRSGTTSRSAKCGCPGSRTGATRPPRSCGRRSSSSRCSSFAALPSFALDQETSDDVQFMLWNAGVDVPGFAAAGDNWSNQGALDHAARRLRSAIGRSRASCPRRRRFPRRSSRRCCPGSRSRPRSRARSRSDRGARSDRRRRNLPGAGPACRQVAATLRGPVDRRPFGSRMAGARRRTGMCLDRRRGRTPQCAGAQRRCPARGATSSTT